MHQPKEIIDSLVSLMDPEDRVFYRSCRVARNVPCFDDRVLVLFDLTEGRPSNLQVVWVDGLQFDPTLGVQARLRDSSAQVQVVGHIPERIMGRELLVHVPPDMRVRWSEARMPGEWGLYYALRVITRSSLDRAVNGVTYIETLNEFRAAFPGVSLRPYGVP